MKATSQREDLIYLLNQAAELEHGLACSYLFAAFSLKNSVEEGLTTEAVATVQNWKRVLRGIAIEEMGHLGVVSNLLTSIGGAPHLSRPNFPQPTSYYLPDYSLSLQPFSESTLEHFIYVERPGGHHVEQVLQPEANEPLQVPTENDIGPNPERFKTVAAFYEAIEGLLTELASRLGQEKLFVGRREADTSARHLAFGDFPPITDLSTALAAINSVIEEGEGDRGDREDSHYGRFCRIQEEYRELAAADSSFLPYLPVLENPFPRTPPIVMAEINVVTNPAAAEVADLFDATYSVMLQVLGRYFASWEEPGEEMERLAGVAIDTMAGVLSPLGEVLCRLPAYGTGEERSGPSFGLHRTIQLLPKRAAANLLLEERFEELSRYASGIAAGRSDLVGIARRLEELSSQLSSAA